ncbi:related to SSM4 - involved in mRNA turnover [Cephalotrichum gorgonifer]|uniref:RING-type E3 ubiquitin transferase n=1 Tax=Cephalotrichum gorgonifer TaxID=2041049 RepID=A0AAE8N195_9PEZI|nr:related to SSM4 - involved in mRNA turnover [Cephalotrichum gorgonifer]
MDDHTYDVPWDSPPYARRHHSPSHTPHPDPAAAQIADPDTCRICRGESTPTEPLFYPCKCSGSIKYVHQDCLMEWLSHSQKKHCELCKTPFRFTKLYSPKMPSSLPTYIFFSHIAKYVFANLVMWMRALLVGSVWLFWVPYSMRRVWSLLFWLSDEGLGSLALTRNVTLEAGNATSGDISVINDASVLSTIASIAGNQTAAQLLMQNATALNDSLPANITAAARRLPYLILGALFPSLMAGNGTALSMEDVIAASTTEGTLFGNVKMLQKLTRKPPINRFVIKVLEGQVITILVIICFILVILVRDYVVQQQPEINMRAAFAAQDAARPEERRGAAAPPQAAGPVHAVVPLPEPQLVVIDSDDDDDDDLEWHSTDGEDEDDEPERDARTLVGETEEDFAQDTTRDQHHIPAHHIPATSRPADSAHDHSQGQSSSESEEGRPIWTPSTDTQGMKHSSNLPPLVVSMGLSDKYLRILEEAEGDRPILGDNRVPSADGLGGPAATRADQETSIEQESDGAVNGTMGPEQKDGVLGHALEGSNTLPTPADSDSEKRDSKGKSREVPPPELSHGVEFTYDTESSEDGDADKAPYSRRRAVSDGPQPQNYVNPLANNSWSFSPISGGSQSLGGPSGQTAGPSSVPLTPVEEDSDPLHSATPANAPVPIGDGSTNTAPWAEPTWEETETQAHGDEPQPDAVRTGDDEATAPQDDGPAPPAQENPPRPLWTIVADYLWGDVDDVIEDADDDAEPVNDVRNIDNQADLDEDPDEEEEPDIIGLDQDALDDIEDFEGIMELVGMRGPIVGLFQNALFCACLVFVAIFLCVFLPYNMGRTSVCLAANPMRLVRMLFALSKLVQDLVAVFVGALSLATLSALSVARRLFGMHEVSESINNSITYTWEITANASYRLSNEFLAELPIHTSEIQNFSALSHEALLTLKGHVATLFTGVWDLVIFLINSPILDIVASSAKAAFGLSLVAKDFGVAAASAILRPGAWIIDLDRAAPQLPVDPELAVWSGSDRFWAIMAGYISFAVTAGLYVSRWAPLSRSQVGQDWEASIVDVINQASGVTKVILIIGIEMLVFPLYCGLLMDVALLPLFEDATILSRYNFTINHPLTSMFVHWFVGTGYMFHFALFVSMCRKIMRKGVLYFIRDPDDPEFHPVRDVLERNFFTQLRKIMFSALVYGGLVLVCLGGVVWGLRLSSSNLLPIHYSSNEPVLEFPVDLLFYNFLMPLAVKVLRPSDALHSMYTWWYKRCGRMLRLTWFLFGKRQVDEEGTLVLPRGSPYLDLPWYRRIALKIDETEQVAPKSLGEIVTEMLPSTSSKRIPKPAALARLKQKLVRRGQLRADGRFVRAPASDQVRIPKARRVFLDVAEATQAPLAPSTTSDTDLYYSSQYELVYLPPNFRLRIFYFIFLIWVFAAVTGVGLTIVPLIVGRRLFKALLPDHVRTNDIYAFSIGIYVLGATAYSILRARTISRKVRGWAARAIGVLTGPGAATQAATLVLRTAQFVYAYFNVFVFFPLLASTLVELYVVIPLHTYLHPPGPAAGGSSAEAASGLHTVRAVQAWTLGLLYLKLASRALGAWDNSRLAIASRAIFRRGYLRPDVPLLTRAFVLPAVLIALVGILAPPLVVVPVIKRVFLERLGAPPGAAADDDPVSTALVHRISFLVTATAGLGAAVAWSLLGVFRGWKARVRDEAYLVGERLHNFGVAARRGVLGSDSRAPRRRAAA